MEHFEALSKNISVGLQVKQGRTCRCCGEPASVTGPCSGSPQQIPELACGGTAYPCVVKVMSWPVLVETLKCRMSNASTWLHVHAWSMLALRHNWLKPGGISCCTKDYVNVKPKTALRMTQQATAGAFRRLPLRLTGFRNLATLSCKSHELAAARHFQRPIAAS